MAYHSAVLFLVLIVNSFHHTNAITRNRRGIFSCKEKGDSCNGFPKCCGDLQCYYKDEYRPFRSGICVTCVERDLVCQLDSNCCEGLQCDKQGDFQMNGRCKPPRALGEKCWENSQCASGNCSDPFYHSFG